jgi:hypothetical protein
MYLQRTLRLLFRLPLRQTEGLLHSLLTLMDLTLPCPNHTTLSRRKATVVIQQQVDMRRLLEGEAGCVPGTGSLSGMRVAQSDAGTGSSSVLCGPLKAGGKGPLHLLLDSCNNAAVS